jgi:hypothetical protein
MSTPKHTSGSKEADFLEQLQLPFRGLAREGASEIIGRALRDLPGVATVTVRAVERVVQVTYDPARITAEAIRERMHTAGLVHPERDAGAHGPE